MVVEPQGRGVRFDQPLIQGGFQTGTAPLEMVTVTPARLASKIEDASRRFKKSPVDWLSSRRPQAVKLAGATAVRQQEPDRSKLTSRCANPRACCKSVCTASLERSWRCGETSLKKCAIAALRKDLEYSQSTSRKSHTDSAFRLEVAHQAVKTRARVRTDCFRTCPRPSLHLP